MRSRVREPLAVVALAVALTLLALGGVFPLGLGSGSQAPRSEPSAAACPQPRGPGTADHASPPIQKPPRTPTRRRAAAPIAADVNPACVHSADAVDAANFDAALTARLGASPGQYVAAIAARRRMLKRGPKVPGGRAVWRPAADGPLVADSPQYPISASSGYGNLSGRVSSFAYDKAHQRVFAAASQGGVWESDDLGASWRSIGAGLPTQITGAVGYSSARGGTIIAATGDNAFGGYTYGGLGIFYSSDDGRSWHRARGIPAGALSFKVAPDSSQPGVVYVATGFGLYRSADGGRSFQNVRLPTGRCAGVSLRTDCFLANMVTDVVVQSADHFGHRGGAVLAAVGWRAGAAANADGSPQSPANGLYSSATGRPGSFQRLAAPGFAAPDRIGRVALGAASGPDQNHGYVYAEVQDVKLFNTQKLEGLDIPSLPDPLGLGLDLTRTATVLNGVYVSADFGRTWTEMSDYHGFELPLNGSRQTSDPGYELLGSYGPGIQAWYNEWIQPDPTRSSAGAPTRVLSGLEELWQTSSTSSPATGFELFHALTQYNGNQSPDCILVLLQQLVCQTLPQNTVSAVHPDQHAGIFIPDAQGGTTLLIGNDGGVYRQHVGSGRELSVGGFGRGSQTGLQTLEPYGVSIARDGTIYAGLQDNGNVKITPDRRQFETLGGDGVFTAVDPANSKVAYSTLPGGVVFVTTDGGHSWRNASSGAVTNPSFYTPLAMDPLNAKHLVTGGRQVVDTTSGPSTAMASNGLTVDPATDWKPVFDLGTRKHPGDPNAVSDPPADAENQMSAVAVQGAAEYAGYCGGCDPVKDHARFGSGIATNVGGPSPAAAGSTGGWHIAAANGLPHRIITSAAIDPLNPRHVFVTLGSSTLRPFAPPGALGNDGVATHAGAVYESQDAGRSFANVSGNLPAIGAAWVAFHRRQLVLADTVGVFASTANISKTRVSRLRYGVLGRGLPSVSVFSLTFSPGDPDLMVAATFGRGVWTYRFGRR
ncbi:MAG: hypothetical protein ACR2JH_09820 [Solirubrobacteraceae bacterium]